MSAALFMSVTEARGETVVRLDGTFDVPAAKRLVEYLDATRATGRLCVDASKVARFDDFGIATLAQALKKLRPNHLRLVGFRTHQLRLLKYFGYDAAPLSDMHLG